MATPQPIQPAPGTAFPPIRIDDGVALISFAYDVGLAIDLDRAQHLLSTPDRKIDRESLRVQGKDGPRAPEHFEFRPEPLRVERPAQPIDLGHGFQTEPVVELTLYDFGGVAVTYRLPIPATPDRWLKLAETLYENQPLQLASKLAAEETLRAINAAVRRPLFAPIVEDYVIYHVRKGEGLPPATNSVELNRFLARILRAEGQNLSDQQTEEALAGALSYSDRDVTHIDWNAAIVVSENADDIISVLEYANMELAELRFMDDRLDTMLESAYEAQLPRDARPARKTGTQERSESELRELFNRGLTSRSALRRLAAMQMDSALMFEGINNALKLLGDQYLARVYQSAARRLHLPDWDASVLRKISILEGLYQKASDRQTNRRMEILEWIIILLIAFEIVMSLLKL
ncbi:MAG: hypothetical protein IBJ18_04455 [Phycisphaerales bacterium]|nr:hypothetical protein [Phycisphaerales bacterium]